MGKIVAAGALAIVVCIAQVAKAGTVEIALEPLVIWSSSDNKVFESYDEACTYSIGVVDRPNLRNLRCDVNPIGWIVNGRVPGLVRFDWVSGGSGSAGHFSSGAHCPGGTTAVRPFISDSSPPRMTWVCKITIETQVSPPCDCETETRGNPVDVLADQKIEQELDLAPLAGGVAISRTYRSGVAGGGDRFNWNWINDTIFPSQAFAAPASFGDWCFVYDIQVPFGLRPTFRRCLPVVGYTNTFAASVLVHDASGQPKELEVKGGGARTADRRREFWKGVGADGIESYFLLDEYNRLKRYASDGSLLSVTLPSGQQTRLSYQQQGAGAEPTQLTDSFGRGYTIQYGSDGLVASISDGYGSGVAYQYTTLAPSQCAGRSCKLLTGVQYADGTSIQYLYNEQPQSPSIPGRVFLTGKVDERGVRLATFTYDATGRPISTEHAGGANRFSFSYPANGNSRSVLHPSGKTETLTFGVVAGYRRALTRSHVDGAATVQTVLAYDASNGNVASVDDFEGKRVCSSYDSSRNLEVTRVEGLSNTQLCSGVAGVGVTLPAGSRKLSKQWHPDWRLQTKLAEPERITTYVYNGQPDPFNANAVASCAPTAARLPDGKPIAVLCKQVEQATTDADGSKGFNAALREGVSPRVRSWTYDEYGQVLTAKDPLNRTTTYEYHGVTAFAGAAPEEVGVTKGDLKQVTNAAGHITRYTKYNRAGQVLETVDANSVTTSYTYDARRRLTSTTVGGRTTTYSYTQTGLLERATSPDGSYVQHDYDDAHRLKASWDNLGNRIDYELDAAGNRTAENVKDPSGTLRRQLSRVFDALGRVKQTTGRE